MSLQVIGAGLGRTGTKTLQTALVELGFLTNKEDEAQLMSPAWREKVTGALVGSVDAFFAGRGAGASR